MTEKISELLRGGLKGKLLILVVLLLVGVLMIRLGTDSNKSETAVFDDKEKQDIEYAEMIEKKIKKFLETVDGVKVANVFVTVDGGYEKEYAKKGDGGGYVSDYLVINSGDGAEAALVRTVYPRIRGVAISCTGGETPGMKERIISLLSAGLGIGTNKIEVVGI